MGKPDNFKKSVDLDPSDWHRAGSKWVPKIGNDPLPGEKPHIWQEFKRDLDKQRYADEPLIGRGWPIMVFIGIVFAVQLALKLDGGPEWLIALRSIF